MHEPAIEAAHQLGESAKLTAEETQRLSEMMAHPQTKEREMTGKQRRAALRAQERQQRKNQVRDVNDRLIIELPGLVSPALLHRDLRRAEAEARNA